MGSVNLTKKDTRTSVNLTKGASQADINNAAANAMTYRDDAEGFRDTAETHKNTAQTQAQSATSSANSASASAVSASSSAVTATTKASEASTSASNAATSETNAGQSATDSANSATASATSATSSATSATAAATSATNASASKNAAEVSATDAAASASQAEILRQATADILDQFGDQYLGSHALDPTTDNDGDALDEGDIYWNSTDNTLRIYTGIVWVAPETIATTAANNAQLAQAAAEVAEANAELSEIASASSESNAAASATAASTSAANAATSEANASTSATNAGESATAASTSESNAAISASNAATSESNAATSAATVATYDTTYQGYVSDAQGYANSASTSSSTATTQAGIATTQANNASTSATNASTSETNASNSASTASTQASNASASASSAASAQLAAEAARDSALAAYDSFDDRYLGAKSTEPTTDNDGDTLVAGSLFFDTTTEFMKLYTGSEWVSAYVSAQGALFAANNLSDLADASTARINLGLGSAATTDASAYEPADSTILKDADIGSTVQGYDANIVSDASYNHITVTSSSVSDGTNTFNKYTLPSDVVQDASYVHTDNNYTTTEKTKLSNIEDNANNYTLPSDVVQDASYVHTDNNYTTTEKNKLAGIEAGATADMTAAEILSAIKTVDGSGSGLDADLLDGISSSSFLRSDANDSTNSNISGGIDSALSGFILPQNPEGKHVKSPFFFNDIAYSRIRGATVSVDVDGTQMTYTSAIDAMFNTSGDFWNITTSGVTTATITVTNTPKTLTYGSYIGISFGNTTWRAKNVTLQYSTDGGNTWTTARSVTNQSEEFVIASFGMGAGVSANAFRWILSNFNTTSMRVASLFAYNYNSGGMKDLYVSRDGGSIYSDISVSGDISVTGTVDGRDVAADGTKLDGIEAGATADQTASEIKTAYESNADTNALTDTLLSKLNGIESGATADQTPAEILTAIKTVDGSGSGLDADLLDGYNSNRFFRRVGKATATVGGGWMTVATCGSGRYHGEVIVTDADSSDHSFIRIDWMRSFTDSNFTVINCGGHNNRITGARVLYQTSDNTYGEKILQVYVTTSSNYEVNVYEIGDIDDYGALSVHTPTIENSISGYAVHGNELTGLDSYGHATEEGILAGGPIRSNSGFIGDGSQLTGIDAGVPSGCVVMWTGNSSNVPDGWYLCDGNNGTPNLIGKFIKGGNSSGGTGGSSTTSSSGSHSHTTGSLTLSTAQMPAHKHKFKASEGGGSYGGHIRILAGSGWGGGNGAGDIREYYTNSNTNIGSSGSHNHGNTSTTGSHTHTIEPVHYELCYIMKG